MKQRFPYIEIIMITAYASLETIRKAIRFGACDYLIKPFDKNELISVVRNALIQRESKLGLKDELDLLKESTQYLEHLIRNAKDTLMNSSENNLTAMLLNIDSRDGYTLSNVKRVTKLSLLIAEKMPNHCAEYLFFITLTGCASITKALHMLMRCAIP